MRVSSAYNGSTGNELPSVTAELKPNSLSRITQDPCDARMRTKSDCVELRTVRNSSDAGYANARFSGQSTRMATRCVSSGETNAFKCALQAPQK